MSTLMIFGKAEIIKLKEIEKNKKSELHTEQNYYLIFLVILYCKSDVRSI